ncbi:MAG: ribonuclease P protein component [Proteobacteria bacterium]|nr:ribonuclease P protein component [Pseudomonadota bacterium]
MRAALPHLKIRADFLRVAASRRRWAMPGVVLQVAPRTGGTARVGYTASRKVGNAVVRNRSRRRLRAAVATLLPGHADAALDYVLIAREATAARPWPALLGDLETAMRRLGAWRVSASA